jgi:hypothetical protein
VIRERIFSSVLLPAPFRPTMPSTCPCSSSNDTSRSAQIVSCSVGALKNLRSRVRGAVTKFCTVSRSVSARSMWPIR